MNERHHAGKTVAGEKKEQERNRSPDMDSDRIIDCPDEIHRQGKLKHRDEVAAECILLAPPIILARFDLELRRSGEPRSCSEEGCQHRSSIVDRQP